MKLFRTDFPTHVIKNNLSELGGCMEANIHGEKIQRSRTADASLLASLDNGRFEREKGFQQSDSYRRRRATDNREMYVRSSSPLFSLPVGTYSL